MPSDYVYNTLSARLIGSLIDQSLAVGMFSVAFVFLRRATLDEGWVTSKDFIKHLLMFFAIILFFSFVNLGYEVEFFRGLGSPVNSRTEAAVISNQTIENDANSEEEHRKIVLESGCPNCIIGRIASLSVEWRSLRPRNALSKIRQGVYAELNNWQRLT